MANADAEATIALDFGHTTAPAALGSTVAEGPTDNSDDVVNARDADHGRVENDDSREDQDLTYHDGLTDGIINELETELRRAVMETLVKPVTPWTIPKSEIHSQTHDTSEHLSRESA